jgi:RNA polymerase sigma factor (sigma-70 family)
VGWDDAAPAPAEFTEIRDAVNSLPEELRVIIVGLHFGGYKTHELAETLGITRRTIHRREQAAFALLRESLT